MDMRTQNDAPRATKGGGPLPGLLRPPIIFLGAIVVGVVLNWTWPLPIIPPAIRPFGPVLVLCAALVFFLSLREFRRAGTSVRGSERSTAIVRTGPYRFTRNPIYVSFALLLIGLSCWLSNWWLLVTLVPAVALMALIVIPREERFLEHNFPEQYPQYKTSVRRWL